MYVVVRCILTDLGLRILGPLIEMQSVCFARISLPYPTPLGSRSHLPPPPPSASMRAPNIVSLLLCLYIVFFI